MTKQLIFPDTTSTDWHIRPLSTEQDADVETLGPFEAPPGSENAEFSGSTHFPFGGPEMGDGLSWKIPKSSY